MFDGFKRLQLQRKGLSCGRTRRTSDDSPLRENLRVNPWLKVFVFAGFVAMLGAVITIPYTEGSVFDGRPFVAAGAIAVTFAIALLHFFANHPVSFRRNSRVLLIFGIILVQVFLTKTIMNEVQGTGLPENYRFLLVPYALAPMTLSILLGRAQGIFVAVFASLWGTLVVPAPDAIPFLLTSLVGGCSAIYATNSVRRRSRLLRSGIITGLSTAIAIAVFGYFDFPALANFAVSWKPIAIEIATVVLVGSFTAMLVGSALPVLESLFHVTTEISWIELSDLNHPLLKRLTIEAPGTYHHSLVVANLAEAAAEAVGANAAMCRVASYFHDIGKLSKPGYFIENIGSGEENPHDHLTPTMSALIIIAHVKEGVDLAIKNKLNEEMIDIIEQHHGNTLVYYFYRRACDIEEARIAKEKEKAKAKTALDAAGFDATIGAADDDDDEEEEEAVVNIDQKAFRYPGPKPQTREAAIISIADAVESASRTLAKPTPAKIEQLVEEITQQKIKSGQLDECALTFAGLEAIKKSFSSTLRSMLHARISYPKEKSAKTKKKDSAKTEPPSQSGNPSLSAVGKEPDAKKKKKKVSAA